MLCSWTSIASILVQIDYRELKYNRYNEILVGDMHYDERQVRIKGM